MTDPTDSAGVPWKGRAFEHGAPSDDDGSAPERLIEALRRFRSAELGEADVVDAVRDSRLLIPLVAVLGESGTNDHGHLVDKSQELSIVTVAGPDGRNVLPVFTSVAAMSHWNPKARPVPADGVRVALAAADEGTDLVVLDPTSDTEFVIRRPALWAMAQSASWLPSYLDEEILDEFMAAADGEDAVVAIQLAPGDPDARLEGAELLVQLSLVAGLDQPALSALLARLQSRWSKSDLIASRVDSLAVRLAQA
jgi:SseB protein N-terminal domain